jgi:trehalose 6-phosphate synthase
MRPDLTIGHFWHIPFCQPEWFRMLPETWGRALLEGLLSAHMIGLQSGRWAMSFLACCRDVLGAEVGARRVGWAGGTTRVGVYPVGADPTALAEAAARPEVEAERASIEELVGDRTLVLRVDRTELSKNILRGLGAFELALERRPDWLGRVVHLVLLTPSRRSIPEYQDYLTACVERADHINDRFGTPDWKPVVVRIRDNFAQTLAAYALYDVLVVNPVFDGMNLVCREGPLLNRRDGVLVLSANAGAAAELAPASLVVNPFDVDATAQAIITAVEIPREERRPRAERLRALAGGRRPAQWLRAQIRDLTKLRGA